MNTTHRSLLAIATMLTAMTAFTPVTNAQPTQLPDDIVTDPALVNYSDAYGTDFDAKDGLLMVGYRNFATSDPSGKYPFQLLVGTAKIYDADTKEVTQQLFPDLLESNQYAYFGYSVCFLDNNIVAVGAPRDSVAGETFGAVYIFDGITGEQITKIVPNDAHEDRFFGARITYNEGIIAISAIDIHPTNDHPGAVYLFDANTYQQTGKIQYSDTEPDRFGNSIDADNGILAIGGAYTGNPSERATGIVKLYNIHTSQELRTISNPHPELLNSSFGAPVNLHNGIIAIGSPSTQWNDELPAGAFSLFEVATGNHLTTVIHEDTDHTFARSPRFGASIVQSDDIIAVAGTYHAILFDATTYQPVKHLVHPEINQHGYDYIFKTMQIAAGKLFLANVYFDQYDKVEPIEITHSVFAYNLLCQADLTGDGQLDFFDISQFLTHYANQDPAADFIGDGLFDFFDISAFLTQYKAGCP